MSAAEIDLEQVDIFDLRWHEDGPPHELLARMRAEAPVRRNPLPSGGECWVVTRHAEVAEISKNPEIFSSYRGGIHLHPDQVAELDLLRNVLLYKDPPEHTKYRKILQTAFTPNTVAKFEDEIRAHVRRTIDAVIESGRCDFVDDIAIPIPLGVLTELMGVPPDDVPQFMRWTDEIEAAQRAAEPDAAVETFGEMAAYLHGQIERQTLEGNDESLVIRLRHAEVDGTQLNDNEILLFFGLLAFAGNDTTRNTTASGMLALLQRPEVWKELVDDPQLIEGAVEELLRFTSVVQWFSRVTKSHTELCGVPIPEGERVVMWYTSASRDGQVFDDPDVLDIHRSKPDHKAFGGGGRHFCLGAGLARLELKVTFEEIARRMRDMRLAGEIERLPSSWANGLTKMPVEFTPGVKEA